MELFALNSLSYLYFHKHSLDALQTNGPGRRQTDGAAHNRRPARGARIFARTPTRARETCISIPCPPDKQLQSCRAERGGTPRAMVKGRVANAPQRERERRKKLLSKWIHWSGHHRYATASTPYRAPLFRGDAHRSGARRSSSASLSNNSPQ
jgi:hypothetical protein